MSEFEVGDVVQIVNLEKAQSGNDMPETEPYVIDSLALVIGTDVPEGYNCNVRFYESFNERTTEWFLHDHNLSYVGRL